MAEKKGRGKIASLVESIIRDAVEQAGYLLWDVDYYKEGADYNLLVTIEHPDRSKAIDLADCEAVTHLISPLLDENDPIDQMYYLEVSSAGLERDLVRPEHFDYYLGKKVRARLFVAQGGTKEPEGILTSYDNGDVTLTIGTESLFLKAEQIAKITTVYENL